jgi:hypothetical protein
MIGLLVTLLIVVIVIGAIWYLLELLPLDSTFKQVAKVILLVIIVLILISALLGYLPGPGLPKSWC